MEFYKYHGAGNDFIMIDNRKNVFDPDNSLLIQDMCHRRFGIGADGVILLQNKKGYDFEMVYMNADGSKGAMCGNGGRCIVHFAHHVLGIINDPLKVCFWAADGEHEAEISGDLSAQAGEVRLKMQDIDEISERNGEIFTRSGTTPHNIIFVENLDDYPVVENGRRIRNSDPDGVNVNFVEEVDGIFHVRTYERGVEDETLACGTGATSVAIVCASRGMLKSNICNIKMHGGDLTVLFKNMPDGTYKNIWLIGEARCVYKGEWK